jgi:hypothetical protein
MKFFNHLASISSIHLKKQANWSMDPFSQLAGLGEQKARRAAGSRDFCSVEKTMPVMS